MNYPTTVGTTTVYAMGKCPERGCKYARRITVENAPVIRQGTSTYTDWKIPAAQPYGEVRAALSKGSVRHQGWGSYPRPHGWLAEHVGRHYDPYEIAWYAAVCAVGWVCSEHNRFLVVHVIKGTVNENRACNGACMGAVGPSCDCQCGGANHGRAWQL